MTVSELARLARVCEKTVRRYVRQGWLRPRVVRMGGYIRYEFGPGSADQVRRIRDQKRRRLEALSPALARHLRVRLGEGPLRVGIAALGRDGRSGDPRATDRVQCPRCGHVHSSTGAW